MARVSQMLARIGFAAATCFAAAPAWAQDASAPKDNGIELFTPETIAASGEVRLVGVDGEPSWLDGSYGKARFGGGAGGEFRVRPEAIEGNLIWQPRLGWSLMGTVVATAQQGQEHPVDLSEAFFTYKPLLGGGSTKLAVRAGLMWPPVSLEHSGSDWHVTDTLTPSAINAWIGDEVKVGAVEATVSGRLGGSRAAATVAIFGLNDTAGTLLAFRGWALHDEKATAFGLQPLPPLVGFMAFVQAPETRPVIEIDNRPGWYVKLSWSPAQAVEVQAFHYDNRGDPLKKTPALQWGWDTDFDQIAASLALGPVTLKSQALSGRTIMGPDDSNVPWVRTYFRAGYLLATYGMARGSVTTRGELFDTSSDGSKLGNQWSEHGWAGTLAARRELGAHVSLLAELSHIESRKDARATIGLDPLQRQNMIQLGMRLHL